MLVVRNVLQALHLHKWVHVTCGQRTFWPFCTAGVSESAKVIPSIVEKPTEVSLHGRRWLDPYG